MSLRVFYLGYLVLTLKIIATFSTEEITGLLSTTASTVNVTDNGTYNDGTAKLENIIFDLTNPLNEIKKQGSTYWKRLVKEQKNFQKSDVFTLELQTTNLWREPSFTLLYHCNPKCFSKKTSTEEIFEDSRRIYTHILENAVYVSDSVRKFASPKISVPKRLNGIVLHYQIKTQWGTYAFAKANEVFRKLPEIVMNGKKIKYGIIFEENTVPPSLDLIQIMSSADLCIVNVIIRQKYFPMSNGLFREKMEQIGVRLMDIVKLSNSSCSPYYRLRLSREKKTREQKLNFDSVDGINFLDINELLDYSNVATYASNWATNSKIGVIIDSFIIPNDSETAEFTHNIIIENLNKRLIKNRKRMKMTGKIIPSLITASEDFLKSKYLSPGFLRSLLQTVGSKFSDLYISGGTMAEILSMKNLNSNKYDLCDLDHGIDIHTQINLHMGWSFEKIAAMINKQTSQMLTDHQFFKTTGSRLRLKTVFLENISSTVDYSTLGKVSNYFASRHISIGISVQLSNFDIVLNTIYFSRWLLSKLRPWEALWTRSTKENPFVIEWVIPPEHYLGENPRYTNYSYQYFSTKVLPILNKVVQAKNDLVKQYPQISVLVTLADSHREIVEMKSSNFYCSQKRNGKQDYIEALINFATFNNITMRFLPVICEAAQGDTWWNQLKTRDGLSDTSNQCPEFVSRNFFVKAWNYDWNPDACIRKTDTPTIFGINFNQNFSGVTFNFSNLELLRNSEMNQNEAEIILLFIMYKYKLVEIVTSLKRLPFIIKTLKSVIFLQLAEINEISNISMYFHVTDLLSTETTLKLKNIFLEFTQFQKVNVNNTVVSSFALHFSINEIVTTKSFLLEFPKMQENFFIGIEVSNCAKEIINSFPSIKQFLSVHGNLSYIICSETSVPGTNEDSFKMEKYLDSHLYMKKRIQQRFPSLEVHFRLKSFPTSEGREGTRDFLTFISDVNDFALAYKIKYFMFNAIHRSSDYNVAGMNGWWKLKNTEDLANPIVYIEREAEYFRRQTWSPSLITPAASLKFPQNTYQFSVSSVVITSTFVAVTIFFLIILAMTLGRKLRGTQKQLQKLEEDFLNGGVNADTDEFGNHLYLNLRYSDEYEIHLEDILLGPILGFGNFGIVYKGTVEDVPAAVKISRDKSSPEVLRCMLMEIKIMCHVGQHENVVKFIGAYTKGIRRGVIYIMTELCEYGSLECHIRKLKSSMSLIAIGPLQESFLENSNFEMIRFCFEICCGMSYIASKNVVHADLAARNVLLDASLTCKVADFGLSRRLNTDGEYIKNSEGSFPWRWMSLESLTKKVFTTQSDVWSFGMLMFEIFSYGELPYTDLTWTADFPDRLERGLRPDKPNLAPIEIYNKMEECWNGRPQERPNFEQLIKFFRGLRSSGTGYISLP